MALVLHKNCPCDMYTTVTLYPIWCTSSCHALDHLLCRKFVQSPKVLLGWLCESVPKCQLYCIEE